MICKCRKSDPLKLENMYHDWKCLQNSSITDINLYKTHKATIMQWQNATHTYMTLFVTFNAVICYEHCTRNSTAPETQHLLYLTAQITAYKKQQQQQQHNNNNNMDLVTWNELDTQRNAALHWLHLAMLCRFKHTKHVEVHQQIYKYSTMVVLFNYYSWLTHSILY